MLVRCEPAKKLQIAIPSYSGKIAIETIASIMGSADIPCQIEFQSVSRDPYIDRSRNALVTNFLLESDATDLLFLDDDVGFDPQTIRQIVLARRPVVAAVYPVKEFPIKFPIDFLPGPVRSDEEGLIQLAMMPTGLMRLNRTVFDYMPYDVYENGKGQRQLGFFRTLRPGPVQVGNWRDAPISGKYIGEDVYFCWEWRERGGQVFVSPNHDLTHTGLYTWEGNLHRWLLETSTRPEDGKLVAA